MIIFWETLLWNLRRFLAVSVFILGAILIVRADPISILTSIAISAAVTAATTAVSFLLSPKPKPQTAEKGKLQGDLQISTIGENVFINEIYGQRGADNLGGILTGVTFFHISDIRKTVTQTTTSSGNQSSGGKGGGGSQQTRTNEYHYHTDLACLVAKGRTRILEIRAGTDVIYRNFPTPNAAQGTHYEIENASLTGTAPNADSGFSGGYNVPMSGGDTATLTIQGDGKPRALFIHYYCLYDGVYLNVTVNGTARTIACPNTYGRIESVMLVAELAAGNTTVFIQAPGADVIWLDKVSVGQEYALIPQVQRFAGISNVKNYDYINPYDSYNYLLPMNPLMEDYRAADEYNYQPVANNTGEQAVTLPAGCTLRIYEGTMDQLPDPLLQQFHEPVFGAGSTPAFRDRCYFVLENFEITKYGSVPNFTVIVESVENPTVGDMFESRARRAGLLEAEMDFEALKSVPLRGFAITQRQAPRTEMELFNRIHDLDVIENNEGKIEGVIPGETVLVQIPANALDVAESETENTQMRGIETLVRNEFELPKRIDLSYFDPTRSYEVGNTHALREVTVSEKQENIETSIVLTESEAKKIADRLLQQEWAEKDGESFTTFYRYGWLNPSDLIEVVDSDGQIHRVRIKERNGNVPGKLTFSGVSRNILEIAPRIFIEPLDDAILPPWATVPPHMVGTILDVVNLRSTDNVPGVYIGAAMTDQAYQFKGAALYWERDAGYELLSTIQKQATFGRTVLGSAGVLANPSGGYTSGSWDAASSVTFDLFFGEVESRTDAEVLDGFNTIVIGNEVIQFGVAVRVNGFPNRWTISRLQRKIKGTSATGHVSTERVLLLNDAVKFVPIDTKEYQIARNYKFVSSGQDITSASKFTFTWNGNSNIYGPPLPANLVLIPQSYELADKTMLRTIYIEVAFQMASFPQVGRIYWQRPDASTFELYDEVSSDSSIGPSVRIPDLQLGTHKFKVITVNANSNAKQTQTPVEYTVVVAGSQYTINGKTVEPAVDRSLTGLDVNAQYVGRDTTVVPRNRISAQVIKGIVVDGGLRVDVNVAGEVINAKIEQAAQGDSIFRSYVKVFNKFGVEVTSFIPDGFTGAGTLGKGTYRRANADPYEEAYFEIIVRNHFGNSSPKYLYRQAVSDVPPTLKVVGDCPQNMTAEPLSSDSIVINATFNFSGGKTVALQKREVGQRYADWVTHVSGISGLPYVPTGLVPDKLIEIRLVSSVGTDNASEIRQVKTYQVGQNSPTRNAPSGLSVTPDNLNPYQNLDVNWTRNATDNTSVDIEINGAVSSLGAAVEHYDINSIGEGQTRTVRVRNVWNTGTPYSAWTDYKQGQTGVSPPPTTPPSNFQGVYDNANQEADLSWSTGTANNQVLEVSNNGSSGWANTGIGLGNSQTSVSISLPMNTSYAYYRYYRIRNDAGYASGVVEIFVPQAQQPANEPPYLNYVYTIQESFSYLYIGGNFTAFVPTGSFSIVAARQPGGAPQYIGIAGEGESYFQIQFERELYGYEVLIWIEQDGVVGQSNAASVTIVGNGFQ